MTDTASDETLMLLYREGEADAFGSLYARHKGPLYRYLLRQSNDLPSTEALFEDIWMGLIAARAEYRPRSDFAGFFYRLAQDRLNDRRHRAAQFMALDDDCFELVDSIDAAPQSQAGDPHACWLREVGTLPDGQREVFLLKEEIGLDIEGIAAVLQLDPEAVQNRLRTALRRLRARLPSAALGVEDKNKVVSLLDESDLLISSGYRELAVELPEPDVDARILQAAQAAVAALEVGADTDGGEDATDATPDQRAVRATGWIAAGIVAVLALGVFGPRWLADKSTATLPARGADSATPVQARDTATAIQGAEAAFADIGALWYAGRRDEARAAFEAFRETYPGYVPDDASAVLYRELSRAR
ncbi:MAG: sigma-70 family RNA polymerase sigma factor [Thiohalobacteraceae bacterium]